MSGTPYLDVMQKISGVLKNMTKVKGLTSKITVAKPEALKPRSTSSILSGRQSSTNPLNRTLSTTRSTAAVSSGPKPPPVKISLF